MTSAAPQADPRRVDVPLDEVMLAMDVVDTLRHQRAQVAAELDEDQRRAQLIARVQSIYESQGMEVPEEVIAAGVQALVEDRFVYTPPERSLAVRLAEIYVERLRWAKRTALVGALLLGAWLLYYIPLRIERGQQLEGYRVQLENLSTRVTRADNESKLLRRRLDSQEVPDTATASAELLATASSAWNGAQDDLRAVRKALGGSPEVDTFLDTPAQHLQFVSAQGEVLDRVNEQLGQVDERLLRLRKLLDLRGTIDRVLFRLQGTPLAEDKRGELEAQRSSLLGMVDAGNLEEAEQGLRSLQQRIGAILKAREDRQDNQRELQRLVARLEGMRLDAGVRREMDALVAGARAAIAAEDDVTASQRLRKLSTEIASLDQEYELRIVSGRGKRSGVWRNTPGRQRNHYIIVEAIGKGGRRLRLPIRNEENNRVDRVGAFGVRVSAATFEQVKQDKLDNGIIDKRRFGRKARGKREVEYFYPVTGGRITRW